MRVIKKIWKGFALAIAAIVCFFLVACKSTFEDIESIPPIVFSESKITRSDLAYHFSKQAGFNSVRIKVPTTINVLLVDSKYKPVDYYWFRKFNNWFQDMLYNNNIQALGDKTENLDCDNFAMLYKSMISVAAFRAGDVYEPSVALLVLRTEKEFGGIPGTGGLHMNVLVMTSHGWLVVEPQTGKFILLENYPNQHTVSLLLM